MSDASLAYKKLVEKEREIYTGEAPAASIPSIFTYWASRYLSPRLTQIFGTPSIEQLFANEIARIAHSEMAGQEVEIVSLGSGECSLERDIANHLITMGVPFKFICTDIVPAMLEAGERLVTAAGLGPRFRFVLCDVNEAIPIERAHFVIANHCLHHFVNLENIFDWTRKAIAPCNGAFVASDMIGRNGHMRWPEALEYVEKFWRILPMQKRYDWINQVTREEFVNFDCAEQTFEGIRAQDILPLCLQRFHFDRFVGYGNLPDVFVDRMYGPNFSPSVQADLDFIDLLEMLNTQLMRAGVVKPTMMFATMRAHETPCVYDLISPQDAERPPT